MRNMQKALLYALLLPNKQLAQLQEEGKLTQLMMQQEEMKTYPMGDVWNYFCEKNGVPVGVKWFEDCEKYAGSRAGMKGTEEISHTV